MTGLEHTAIALPLLWIAYTIGRYISKEEVIENALTNMLAQLEEMNYIKCRTNKEGDKELLEVVEKPKDV